ncbi:MAG TPA: Zn-ribbon domain-containing OB-fold protein [Acidimicrobiales bacterium]|nr:Zn-ribbon domain-containing OB-fold protein [Acidimicrobiales bacterium]
MSPRPAGALPVDLAELHPDPWTAPFWAAAAEHRLVCARCADCGTYRMPPTAFCHVCRSQELTWVELPGTGSVYTFTIVRHPVIPEVRASVPYVLAVIELDGAPGARLVANVLEVDPLAVHIGMPVTVAWDDVSDEVTVARFVPRLPD